MSPNFYKILNQYFLMILRPILFCKQKLKRAGPSEPALLDHGSKIDCYNRGWAGSIGRNLWTLNPACGVDLSRRSSKSEVGSPTCWVVVPRYRGTKPKGRSLKPGTGQLSLSGLEIIIDRIPVDDIEKCTDIFRSAVLVFQIVSVLPDIDAQNRRFALA